MKIGQALVFLMVISFLLPISISAGTSAFIGRENVENQAIGMNEDYQRFVVRERIPYRAAMKPTDIAEDYQRFLTRGKIPVRAELQPDNIVEDYKRFLARGRYCRIRSITSPSPFLDKGGCSRGFSRGRSSWPRRKADSLQDRLE